MQRRASWLVLLAALSVQLVVLPSLGLAVSAGLDSILTFEASTTDSILVGWGGGPPGTLFLDRAVVHRGTAAARIERDPASPRSFSTLTKSVPVDVAGATLELRGFLRTEEVQGSAGLWLREDGDAGVLQFDNMQRRGITGTTDWTEYSIILPLDRRAREIRFGVLLSGHGKVWADDLRLLVDGKPIAEAPQRELPTTALDLDREFDAGSGIEASQLTSNQIANLATLGKVWGFLKYHHPQITAGEVHWDYELFRIVSSLLEAESHDDANALVLAWVERQGEVERCDPCGGLPGNAHLLPRLAWLEDQALLGSELSERLRWIHYNRDADGEQFFVSHASQVKNPDFSNERAYREFELPDAGYRLLALFRYWNIIEYWFPYRDVMDEDWDGVLVEFIPRFFLADTPERYDLELWALIARIHDTHAHLGGRSDVRPPRGACALPVRLRFIEKRFVVTDYLHPELGAESGFRLGDAIVALDGLPVDSLAAAWMPWYAASNEPRRMLTIAQSLTRGKCGECDVTVMQDGDVSLSTRRVASTQLDQRRGMFHDLPGDDEFRLLTEEVAYLKLSGVETAKVADYVRAAAGTRGLVIDIRNYPSEFVVFALGQLLVTDETPFACFTEGDLTNPGAFIWTESQILQPHEPHYAGHVVILVDEASLSQAEYTAMALRAAPGARVVGSTTAGADGNVSAIPLPGGRRTAISGIGVFYPDKTPTQRVGIIPDLKVHSTIAGIRAGRDEVLETAVELILGRELTLEETVEWTRQ